MPTVAYDAEVESVCAGETETFHTNTAALSEECRLVHCLGVRASRLFSHLSVYFPLI